MDARNGRVNLSGGSATTNGNDRPNTRRNRGRAQAANLGAGASQVDMGAIYQFFVNLVQAGSAAGLVGGNVERGNRRALMVSNYAVLSRDYVRLGGKPLTSIKDAIEVANW